MLRRLVNHPGKVAAGVATSLLLAEFAATDSLTAQRWQIRKRLRASVNGIRHECVSFPALALPLLPKRPAADELIREFDGGPAIITGPPICGKSSAMRALASEFAAPQDGSTPRPVALISFTRLAGLHALECAARAAADDIGISRQPSLLAQHFPSVAALLRGEDAAPKHFSPL